MEMDNLKCIYEFIKSNTTSSRYPKGRFGNSKIVTDNEVKREVQTFVKEALVDKQQVQEDKDVSNEIVNKQTTQEKHQFRFNGNENQARFGGTRAKFTFDTISSSSRTALKRLKM